MIEFIAGPVLESVSDAGTCNRDWILPDGTYWLSFYKTATGHLLRFPGLADFEVSLDGQRVVQMPVAGTDAPTLEHLYLNQVLPLVRSLRGELVFHAGAVAIDSGAVAFMGQSGRGKSTLTASFASNGVPFLTDDGLQLHEHAHGYLIEPSHPSIRLWNDSREALVHSDAALAQRVRYTDKARVLSDDQLSFCLEPKPLRCVYFLGEGEADDVQIEPVKPSAALMELVHHSFMLDVSTEAVIARHFDALTRMVAYPMFFRLDYPRRFDMLPLVREAITQHVAQSEASQSQ